MIRSRLPIKIALLLLAGAVLSNLIIGFAASNAVVVSAAGDSQHGIDPNELAPPECAGINLTNIVDTHSSTYTWFGQTVFVFNGTNANDLIIGTNGYDDLIGNRGNDCLVGGVGIDYFFGNGGSDVCIGLGGDDVFNSCESQATRARAFSADDSYRPRPGSQK